MQAAAKIASDLKQLRKESPLVHNITNYVVMNFSANALLAIGASPVMAHAIEEVDEMTTISRALVINIGTLSAPWVSSMKAAIRAANQKKIPVIFDPVGVGATTYRTETARDILQTGAISVIRGNASEISALSGMKIEIKGVDSTVSSKQALEAGRKLSSVTGAVVCISGVDDFVIGENQVSQISNGDPLMTKVTGMGCAGTALIAAFAAIQSDRVAATESAMAVMGIAGEIAAKNAKGPGSFELAFLDSLYSMDAPKIERHLRLKRL